MFKRLALICCLTLLSCQKEYTSEVCDELSQMTYKGYPNQSREFKDHCQGVEITYTQERCQSALSDLMLGKSLDTLKSTYGEHIDRCFTENDLARFHKPSSDNQAQ